MTSEQLQEQLEIRGYEHEGLGEQDLQDAVWQLGQIEAGLLDGEGYEGDESDESDEDTEVETHCHLCACFVVQSSCLPTSQHKCRLHMSDSTSIAECLQHEPVCCFVER